MKKKLYRSARDRRTSIIYFALILLGLFLGNFAIFQLVGGVSEETLWFMVANVVVGYVVAFLFIITYLVTYYEFDDRKDHLFIRGGPFVDRIPYKEIKEIEFVRGYMLAMALSTDRIKLTYGTRKGKPIILHLSPERKEEFRDALLQRCPRAKWVEGKSSSQS